MEAVSREEPDVVLTDIRMPPGNADEGVQVAAELRTSAPDIGVVVISQYAEPRYPLLLLEAGSDGRAYLLKDHIHDRTQLPAAIRTVAAGGSMIDPKVVEVLVTSKTRAERSQLAQLTGREL